MIPLGVVDVTVKGKDLPKIGIRTVSSSVKG